LSTLWIGRNSSRPWRRLASKRAIGRFGGAEFKAKRLEMLEGKLGQPHSGEVKRESAEAKAQRIIGEELKRLGWPETDLKQRPKRDPSKLAVAARLRRETTLTLSAIAVRLHLGSWKTFKAKLDRWRQSKQTPANVPRL
jgi:hypothetical protein